MHYSAIRTLISEFASQWRHKFEEDKALLGELEFYKATFAAGLAEASASPFSFLEYGVDRIESS
jgi:hypothetical protein